MAGGTRPGRLNLPIRVEAGDLETGYDGVRAVQLPVGGDTRLVADGLTARREGKAAAFGRFDDGERVARDAVEAYLARVADAVDRIGPRSTRLLVGGALAPHLADRVGDAVARIGDVTVPEGAPVAGAIGRSVARTSVETRVHVDSARGTVTVSSIGSRTESVERGRTFDDAEVESIDSKRYGGWLRRGGVTATSERGASGTGTGTVSPANGYSRKDSQS